eukprot:360519-Chlamydomonas_euryale.AAC.3
MRNQAIYMHKASQQCNTCVGTGDCTRHLRDATRALVHAIAQDNSAMLHVLCYMCNGTPAVALPRRVVHAEAVACNAKSQRVSEPNPKQSSTPNRAEP